MRPKLFIGSASESLNVAYAIQEQLENDAEITVWTQDVFMPSRTVLDSLLSALPHYNYAIFVFEPHDAIRLRDEESKAVRDNLLFELGLFIGRIGKDRVFFLVPRDVDFHIPTDLIGITPLTYNPTRQDGNLSAAVGSACNKVRNILKTNHAAEPPSTRVSAVVGPALEVSASELGPALVQSIPSDGTAHFDVAAYTGETLHIPLRHLRDAVAAKRCAVNRLSIRLIVWDCAGESVLPRNVRTHEKDQSYLENMKKRRLYPIGKIEQIIRELRAGGVEARFEYRFSPFEPSIKAVVIKGIAVYWSVYAIEEHYGTFEKQGDDGVWDYEGFGRSLSEARNDTAAYRSIERWFNIVWDHFALDAPRN